MNRWAKVGLVVAGYAAAIAASVLSGVMYNARMAQMPFDTSGGMYAGGEMLTEVGTFLVVAMAPTLLALWFARGNRRLWLAVAWGSLGFACVGLIGELLPLAIREPWKNPWLLLLELFGLAQLLGVPLWTAAFALFAFLAPTRPARRLLVAAVGVELVVGVFVAFHWLSQRPPF